LISRLGALKIDDLKCVLVGISHGIIIRKKRKRDKLLHLL
jgi:hypothetical protein